jgi:enterochelin esterase family protein
MPVTVGIFIQPGTRADGGSNRSFEYDTLSDQYARFLLEEILP